MAYFTHLLGSENSETTPYSQEKIQEIHPFRCDSQLAEKLVAVPSEEK